MPESIQSFFDLTAWQKGHKLALEVYRVSKLFPRHELYGLTSQLRRASSSVTANIAEGFGRYHFKDKIRFYYQARVSLSEIQSFVVLARDLGYFKDDVSDSLLKQTATVAQLINGLIRSTEKQSANYKLRITDYS